MGGPPGVLAGRRIVVTRPLSQAADLAAAFEALGAAVSVHPLIRIAAPASDGPLLAAAGAVEKFDWLVFTSVNGVAAFQNALRRVALTPEALASVAICAIGPATAAAVEAAGARAALVAREHVAEGVVEALRARADLRGARILLPQAEIARGVLADSLRDGGAEVTAVVAYRTLPDAAGGRAVRRLIDAGAVDMVTFTSSSAVESYAGAGGRATPGVRIASIGPITTRTAQSLGIRVDLEADPYTAEGMVDAVARYFGGARHGR